MDKIKIYFAPAPVLAGNAPVNYGLGSKPASCVDSSACFHSHWHYVACISFPGFSIGKTSHHPCHFQAPACVVPGPLPTGTVLPRFPRPWKASLTPNQTPVLTQGWAHLFRCHWRMQQDPLTIILAQRAESVHGQKQCKVPSSKGCV